MTILHPGKDCGFRNSLYFCIVFKLYYADLGASKTAYSINVSPFLGDLIIIGNFFSWEVSVNLSATTIVTSNVNSL